MRIRSSRRLFGIVLCATALFAAACGGSGVSRTEAVAALTDDQLSQEEAECVVDGIEDSDDVSLSDLKETASDGVKTAVVLLVRECVVAGSTSGAGEEGSELGADAATPVSTTQAPDPEEDGGAPGRDAELDALWVACAEGDTESCGTLFWQSPPDSDYEAFGMSCGGHDEGCLGSDTASEGSLGTGPGRFDFDDLSPDDPPPGNDPELDALWVECSGGVADACDELFFAAPADSDYERFGFSCGARASASCSDILGDSATDGEGDTIEDGSGPTEFSDLSTDDPPPGDDADLDNLWITCSNGSSKACDQLYFDSPFASDYERFGYSCGAREVTSCAELLG